MSVLCKFIPALFGKRKNALTNCIGFISVYNNTMVHICGDGKIVAYLFAIEMNEGRISGKKNCI